MIDERQRFERAFELFEMPEPAFDRLVVKRTRLARRRRVGALIVATGIAVGGAVLMARAWFPPTHTPAHLPTPTVVPQDWVRFDSPFSGYSISLPPDWTVTPATSAWVWGDPRRSDLVSAEIPVPGGSHTFDITIASTVVPSTLTEAEWTAYEEEVRAELDMPCERAPSVEPIEVDGNPGHQTTDCGDHLIVSFLTARRAFVITTLSTDLSTDLDLVRLVLGTVRIRPDLIPPATTDGTGWRGIWPQTTETAAAAVQAEVEAGDPSTYWQVDWNQDGIVARRFVKEQLGWKRMLDTGVSYVPSDSGQAWEAEVVEWYFIRCDRDATNPLYPDDPIGGECAPTIDQTHYDQIVVRAEQLVRQGRSGIWLVTGWDHVEPYEQTMPPSDDDRVRALRMIRSFLEARISGAGAEPFLVPAADAPRFHLYTSSDLTRFGRFEVAGQPSAIGVAWPFGGFGDYVARLFPTSGGGCQVERIHVTPADTSDPRGPLVLSQSIAQSGHEGEYREGSRFCSAPLGELDAMLW